MTTIIKQKPNPTDTCTVYVFRDLSWLNEQEMRACESVPESFSNDPYQIIQVPAHLISDNVAMAKHLVTLNLNPELHPEL
ncbi:MAG: hypothetical protein CR991_10275 [Proteobacteria bacterium]|nr:MAG: hypothetical protein CR991_10275 [Pseudomonadota bacterium]